MRRKAKGQAKVSIGVEALWQALAKDTVSTIPASVPALVTAAEILQGDGGFGTVYHFKFGPGVPDMRYQKERIAEYDEEQHRIGLEVIEGGRLDLGYTYYKTSFELTALSDSETLVDVEVDWEAEGEEGMVQASPGEKIKSGVAFIQALEAYLLKK